MNPATITHVPAGAIPELERLYDRGRYLAAHTLAVARHGPLAGWSGGAAALVFAGRLAGNLGGDCLGHQLQLRACRRVTSDPESTPADRADTRLFLAYRIHNRRGPLTVRRFLARPGVLAAFRAEGVSSERRASVLCLHAHVAAGYRDADAAESLWAEAHALVPADPWTWTERASLLTATDRYPEALDAAREALRVRPGYRPALQNAAHVLSLLGRDDEAVALLEDALGAGGVESPALAAQLAELFRELLRPTDALRTLDRHEELSPLLEDEGRTWLASRRCEARLALGDLAGAAEAAAEVGEESFFYAKTAERLRDPARLGAGRVHLAVPFVRQHEKTCAPATLAALTHFWQRPADQLAIAAEICYGGTFEHQERHWAETHGWAAREFRADWTSAVALLDAGIPFALVTTGVNSGHLQAAIGYDARRGTLLIRDPFERNHTEWLAEEFFERFAFCGPRALALAPADDPGAAARLRAADLPEAALYEELYRLRRALHVHDRPTATAALSALETLDPVARLTWFAKRELALYDGDDPAALAAVEALFARHPGEGRLRLEKLLLLRRLARPAEARAWLETCAADPEHTEPNLWRELASELAADARQRPRAGQLLRRALFFQPTEGDHLRTFAELRWEERDFAGAAALFRLAACALGTREDAWRQFFIASRHQRETDAALGLLAARFARSGDQSSQPARTLFWAHRERHQFAPAAAVLQEALNRRPADGELQLFAAATHARDGEHARAAVFLAAAEGHAAPGALARAAAELAGWRRDGPAALAHWQTVLAREPLAHDAHAAVARLLAETDPRGPAAARAHLDAAVARFPHAVALHQLRIEWLVEAPGHGHPEHDAAVSALLAVQPTNAWALRERAIAHETRREFPAALSVLEEAQRIEPSAVANVGQRGRVLLAAGDLAAARDCLRRALELDVDVSGVLPLLLQASPTREEKRAALDFMRAELVRQPVSGEGLLAYRTAAYPILEEPELRAQLEDALAARPDLWHAWSAVAWQHADAHRLDEAHARARAAAERFPLLTRVWLDFAAIERLRGEDAAEVAALERALRIRADLGEASRHLAVAHRRAGRFAEARTVLAAAMAAAPLDVANLGTLAETLWQEDRVAHGPRVLEILDDALRREPGYLWAWGALDRCARALDQPDRAEATARLLTQTRPGEARSWLRLAHAIGGEHGAALEERLDALQRALALNPCLDDAYDLRATLLAGAKHWDEALAACEPPADAYPGHTRPVSLRGRAAWITAQRGDLAAARAEMRAVVTDQPNYEWGLRLLADWAEAAGDQEDALAQSTRLAYLDPHAAAPLGYLADAHLRLGHRAEAKAALREAMRRDPAYLFAPVTLLREQLADAEFDNAENTLGFFRQHHPGAFAHSREVLVAVARKDESRAGNALAALARSAPAPNIGDGGIAPAVKAVVDAGWRDTAEAALQLGMVSPGISHPDAGACWVRSRADRGAWKGLEKAVRRLRGTELARRARVAYVTALGDYRQAAGLRRFVRRERAELRADPEAWAQVTYALANNGHFRRVVAWMDGWAERPGLDAWTMSNLAIALRLLGRYDRAVAVHRHALTLAPDHTRPQHVAWVALEDTLDGDEAARLRAARMHAELLPAESDNPAEHPQPTRFLLALIGLVRQVRDAGPDPAARRLAYRDARARLDVERNLAAAHLQASAALRRAEARTRRALTREGGGWWERLRGLVRLPVPLVLHAPKWGVAWLAFIVLNLVARGVLVGLHEVPSVPASRVPPRVPPRFMPLPTTAPVYRPFPGPTPPLPPGVPTPSPSPTPSFEPQPLRLGPTPDESLPRRSSLSRGAY